MSFRPESLCICKALKEPQQIHKDVAEKSSVNRYTFYLKAMLISLA
jgi:hypothetical protein